MSSDYDVIVLGPGSPGEHCAAALVEGGLRIAIVERELVGGGRRADGRREMSAATAAPATELPEDEVTISRRR